MGRWTSLSWGLLLTGLKSLVAPASASGFKLQRIHPQFGKCTSSDLIARPTSFEISFFQEKNESSSDECLQILVEQGTPAAEVLNSSEQANSEPEWFLAADAPREDLLDRAKDFYRDMNSSGYTKVAVAMWSALKKAIEDSTVFVLGTGPEIFLLSKMAKTVVVLENDAKACQDFLGSDAGGCAMQANVHVYCYRPGDRVDSSGASLQEDPKDVSPDTMDQSNAHQAFLATKDLLEELVEQQFGDLPMSALVVLGQFPVAKLLIAENLIDQSTVIFARCRLTHTALAALSNVMRVMTNSGNSLSMTSHSTASIFILQRLFAIERRESPWSRYTTTEWLLQDDLKPRQLVNEVFSAIESAVSPEKVSERKWKALRVYMRAIYHLATRGTDEERIRMVGLLTSLKTSTGEEFESMLARVRETAAKLLTEAATQAGLQEYLKLVVEAATDPDPLLHPVVCELFANATSLIASPNLLGQAKDTIEDACELAEFMPKILLPLLRLIQGGLMGDEYMGKVVQIVQNIKKQGEKVDSSVVSALTEYAEP